MARTRRTLKIEWPPRSGRVAEYTTDELEYVRGFIRRKEAGEITAAALNLQIGHIHDVKVEFGVDLIEDDVGPSV